MDPYLGKRIREYEILELIGKGGMGAVYKARHVFLDRERAIKFIHGNLAADSGFIDRFIREAKILSGLSHRNLVHLYEFGNLSKDTFFMVLEFIRGESVLSRIRRLNRLPVPDAIKIIREAALGLHCAHEQGIIHRDISPDNIVLSKAADGTEVTKVIDFGIAKPLNDASTRQFTATLMFIGKPEYSSPEQCGFLEDGEVIDHRSDIYSLAVTLYYMLSGKQPFYSPTPEGYLYKHATKIPDPVSMHLPSGEIPQALDHLIRKALAKNRAERHPTMEAFAAELDQILNSSQTQFVTVEEEAAKDVGSKREVRDSSRIHVQSDGRHPSANEVRMPTVAEVPVNDFDRFFQEGRAFFEQNRWVNAIDSFRRAYQVYPDPTVGEWIKAAESRSQEENRLRTIQTETQTQPRKQGSNRGLVIALLVIGGLFVMGASLVFVIMGLRDIGSKPSAPSTDSIAEFNLAKQFYDSKNYDAAFQHFKKASDAGHAESKTYLGYMYETGLGVSPNMSVAVQFYKDAAELNDPVGMYNLGSVYYNGAGVEKDFTQASYWLRKSADAGNAGAMNFVGNLYYRGEGVPQSYSDAFAWYTKGASAGNAWSKYNLGDLYENGFGVARNYEEARKWYLLSADAGNGDAMNRLGNMYYSGTGVGQSFQEAMVWYQKGTDAGNGWATRNLGYLYLKGEGTTKNTEQASILFQKAADLGNSEAMKDLGDLYYNGDGVRQDYTAAFGWYTKSADAGNFVATHNMAYMYRQGFGVRQNYDEAIRLYKKAADGGVALSMVHLGEIYRYGEGTSIDRSEAYRWYEKAAKLGNDLGKKGMEQLNAGS